MSKRRSSRTYAGKKFGIRAGLVGLTALALVGGIAQTAQAALPTGPSSTGLTGSRSNATTLSFHVSDKVGMTVDVATGNLLVSTSGLSLPGVTSSVPIGETYNSLGWQTGSNSTTAANRWTLGLDSAGSLSLVGSNVIYTAADGSTYSFAPVSGSSTTFTSPAGFLATLTKPTSTTYSLKDLKTKETIAFDVNGNPTSVTDGNSNATAFNGPSGAPTSIVSTAGPTAARTATLAYNSSTLAYTITQTGDSYNTRTVTYQKDSNGNLTGFTDANGATTSFAYTGSDLTQITGPTGEVTTISYSGTTHKVSEVDQQNTTSGSAGTSTTRITYPTTTQTLVAGPDTNTSVAVATGAHLTYTIDATKHLVTNAVDQMNRQRSATFNGNSAVTSTTTGTGTSGCTGAATTSTCATYGANSGNSLTKVQSPTGASSSAGYTDSSNPYLPTSTTDDAGNQSLVTYSGTGQQATSSDASGAKASLTYNTNGTVATATAPANTGNPTTYTYNSNNQLSTVTPPTGTSLGVKTYTYDAYGRLASETDGRGDTTRYTYDKDDRLLTTAMADSSATVTNTFDADGNLTKQVSPGGTITNTYDQLGQQLSTANTAGGGTESYTYDAAGNQVTSSDSFGTYTNSFDASGELYLTKYPKGSGYQYTDYAVDDHGRRTDTWLQASGTYTPGATAPSTWAGHDQTSYDTNGRVTELKAYTGTGNSSNTAVFDTTYCYNSGSTAPTCGTGSTGDHEKLQFSKDQLSGQVTTYQYDNTGRIHVVTQTGGTTNNVYTYGYDKNGNRTSAVVTGSSPSSQTLTYNAANQITNTGYTYDGTGNLTATPSQSFTYNEFQQMTSATTGGVTSSYTYAGAAENEVLSETTPNGHTYNLIYGKGGTIAQYQVVTSSTLSAEIYNDPTTAQPLMLTTSSDIACLYVWDGLGDPVGLLVDYNGNAFSYSYDPYGAQALTQGGGGNGSAQNPYAFKAGIQDRASGLVKFGQRWYNPTTGSWTQQDTLDAPLSPSSADRYAFAAGDPINNSDPNGNASFGPELTGCFYICVSIGAQVDQDGHVALTGGLGVGDPSVSGGLVGSTGDADTGAGGELSCSAGFAKAGITTGGEAEGSIGTDYSTGQCDAEAIGSLRVS